MSTQRGAPPDDGGPLVRPYTITGGRTRPMHPGVDMITTVVATPGGAPRLGLQPEQRAILRVCRHPVSVAEVSAHLDLPLSVVKVLVSDLVSEGAVLTRDPVPIADQPEMNILQAVLDGIRRI